MIPLHEALRRIAGLEEPTLRIWIAQGWVLPAHGPSAGFRVTEGSVAERPAGEESYADILFDEADLARCRLILELRDELEVNEAAIPVVLNLLDQLYAMRDQLRRTVAALGRAGLRGDAARGDGQPLP